MKNLIVVQDSLHIISCESYVASVEYNVTTSELLILFMDGFLCGLAVNDDSLVLSQSCECSSGEEHEQTQTNDEWLEASFISETSSFLCLSRNGTISIVSSDQRGDFNGPGEVQGCIEGGIATAQWSPDQSILVILTNSNTLIAMTCNLEILAEVEFDKSTSASSASISWRGDGDYFSVVYTSVDGVSKVNVYNKNLEFHTTGRNVADGPGSLLRGVGGSVAFATNGSLIALPLTKSRQKLQVAFLELNGLRHGEFDIQLPPCPSGWSEWKVTTLHWDLATTLLAVGLQAISPESPSALNEPGVVQLYHRNNYHWYLKQQFSGPGLRCLGFDKETMNRLYVTERHPSGNGKADGSTTAAIRIIDLAWDVISSSTRDCSVAVVDGCSLLLTPLGISTVPPPMSAFKAALAAPCRSLAFWAAAPAPACALEGGGSGELCDDRAWGLAALSDGGILRLIHGSTRGAPTRFVDVDVMGLRLEESSVQIKDVCFRSLVATSACESEYVTVALVGARPRRVVARAGVLPAWGSVSDDDSRDDGSYACADGDVLLILRVKLILEVGRSTSSVEAFHLVEGLGAVARLTCWPGDPAGIAVGMTTSGGFEVCKLESLDSLALRYSSGSTISVAEVLGDDVVALPELCAHFIVLSDTMGGHTSHSNAASRGATGEGSIAVDETKAVAQTFKGSIERDTSVEVPSSTGGDDAEPPQNRFAVIGLSARNRLYNGETLLIAGASSFAVNAPLGMLLFVTVGTRPQLHFLSIDALLGLASLQGSHAEYSYRLECAEPRPVERGARLVASIMADAKVVIQLPRGNIEAFEPRPLILMKARQLLRSLRVLDCLILLRRQRVDLNYVVDFNPELFLTNISDLVAQALAVNPELLSLLISALEPADSSVSKYPMPAMSGIVGQPRQPLPALASATTGAGSVPSHIAKLLQGFKGDGKVNIVCQELRAVLSAAWSSGNEKALNPILCTFAKQRPPRLEEALALIAQGAITSVAATSPAASIAARKVALATGKAQSAIRYLAFLAEGSKLFDAALGECDFDLARAVARQCQMDPKAYIPLLEEFAAIGRREGSTDDHSRQALMRYRVNLHLHRYPSAVEWGVRFLRAASATATAPGENHTRAGHEETKLSGGSLEAAETTTVGGRGSSSLDIVEEVDSVCASLLQVVISNDLYLKALSLLSLLVLSLNTSPRPSGAMSASLTAQRSPSLTVSKVAQLLWRMRGAHGAACMAAQQYDEAVSTYLAAEPPYAVEAIKAARAQCNWLLALTIAGRFQPPTSKAAGSLSVSPLSPLSPQAVAANVPSPQSIASAIVADFRASLEQGDVDVDFEGGEGVGQGGSWQAAAAAAVGGGVAGSGGRAAEVASISMDYCDDVESAVAILTMSRRWVAAVTAAVRKNRNDLLKEEIAPALRTAAVDMIKLVRHRGERQAAIVTELEALWADPEERLKRIAEAEPELKNELFGPPVTDYDKDNGGVGGDDSRSEFSALTIQSGASYISNASAASSRSGTSTVSVLSSLSIGANSATPSISQKSFSIEGLDHTLLSRGGAGTGGAATKGGAAGGKAGRKTRESDRRAKRREKQMARGVGPGDVFGLRRESALCDELCVLGQFEGVARSARDMCDALQLVNGGETGVLSGCMMPRSSDSHEGADAIAHDRSYVSDYELATYIQGAVDTYALQVQAKSPPIAPNYPPQWLQKRSMSSVAKLQDREQLLPPSTLPGRLDDAAVPQWSSSIENKTVQDDNPLLATKSWWETAADGIKMWQAWRRKSLHIMTNSESH